MAFDSTQIVVPAGFLISFFREATQALDSCQLKDPLTLAECRNFVLEQQNSCLERIATAERQQEQNASTNTQVSKEQIQQALASISTLDIYKGDQTLQQSMEEMNQAARKAFARLVLTSECLRTNTNSLEKKLNNPEEEESTSARSMRKEPLKTSRMNRSETMEFCALCQAVIRIDSVKSHLQDPKQPLLMGSVVNNQNNPTASTTPQPPPIKRVENLQRLLLQAMGYDADMGLTELAQQVTKEGNDDVELVQVIQQTTDQLLQTLFGTQTAGASSGLLSDQDQGGVTRVLSVQHSEKLVQIGGGEEQQVVDPEATTAAGGAPISQSMRDGADDNNNNTASSPNLAMAQKAAALRDSLVNELLSMSAEDRTALLQQAQEALHKFQRRAMEMPPGPERIEFMRNMDPNTQKLLAMHRIWQEQQQVQQQAGQSG